MCSIGHPDQRCRIARNWCSDLSRTLGICLGRAETWRSRSLSISHSSGPIGEEGGDLVGSALLGFLAVTGEALDQQPVVTTAINHIRGVLHGALIVVRPEQVPCLTSKSRRSLTIGLRQLDRLFRFTGHCRGLSDGR